MLFMLVVFECTVMFQIYPSYLQTPTWRSSMHSTVFITACSHPHKTSHYVCYSLQDQCYHNCKWQTISTGKLLPALSPFSVSPPAPAQTCYITTETTIPTDLLLLCGMCIVNKTMLSVIMIIIIYYIITPLLLQFIYIDFLY